MSKPVSVIVIVEGQTELVFVDEILSPYLGARNVFITPILLSNSGKRGGDVRFTRAKKDITLYLKQRRDVYVSLLVDYYGIGPDWPGLAAARSVASPSEIATAICNATHAEINKELLDYRSDQRFVPYIMVHEFEALLFSDSATLASCIRVRQDCIDKIIQECGEPEAIDNSPQTAPSKRIEHLYKKFKKTSIGIKIAKAIGIDQIRSACPVFSHWLDRLETLTRHR